MATELTLPQVPDGDPSWDGIRSWRDARRLAEKWGWKLIGTGDWAWVYGSPDDTLAWRISPFDPAYDYFAAVCDAHPNRHLPHIARRGDHPHGGSSVLMEQLEAVPKQAAIEWTATFGSAPDRTTAAVLRILESAAGECRLPLFRGLDTNPGNVRRRPADGELVLIDAFWIDGKELFEIVLNDPQRAVDHFGRAELLEWVYIPAMDTAGTAQAMGALASV